MLPSPQQCRSPRNIRTFFITTVTANRRRLFQLDRNCDLLLSVLTEQQQKHRLQLHAFVIMPDHLHLLLTPAPDVSLEKAMQYIKGSFSFRLKSKLAVWQQSYKEHRITGPADYNNHRNYIEQNPVRAGIVQLAAAHPFSSAAPSHNVDAIPEHLRTQ